MFSGVNVNGLSEHQQQTTVVKISTCDGVGARYQWYRKYLSVSWRWVILHRTFEQQLHFNLAECKLFFLLYTKYDLAQAIVNCLHIRASHRVFPSNFPSSRAHVYFNSFCGKQWKTSVRSTTVWMDTFLVIVNAAGHQTRYSRSILQAIKHLFLSTSTQKRVMRRSCRHMNRENVWKTATIISKLPLIRLWFSLKETQHINLVKRNTTIVKSFDVDVEFIIIRRQIFAAHIVN